MGEVYKMYLWNDGAYLMHHGIKGQRWGVRRFQNEDGTLTDAGRKRYGYGARGDYKNRVGIANASYRKGLEESVRRHSGPNGSMTAAQVKAFDKEAIDLAKKRASDLKAAHKEYMKTSEFKKEAVKKALITGAAIAGTALVAYGAYKISGNIKDKAFQKSYNAGKRAVDEIFNDANEWVKNATGLTDYYDKSDRFSLDQDAGRTAQINSSTLANAIRTLRGGRKFSRAELTTMGIRTFDLPTSLATEDMIRSYRRSRGLNP